MSERTCTIDGCTHPLLSRGWCNMHYKRMRKYGSLDAPPKQALEERFWVKVDRSGACWLWMAATDPQGYGRFTINNIPQLAHRVAWQLTQGTVPSELDHQCRVRSCVNPEHLRPVTRKQNSENMGVRSDSGTGVRGVQWDPRTKRWTVRVKHAGKRFWGGRHSSIEEAERVAIDLRNRLFTHNELDRRAEVGNGHLGDDRPRLLAG